MNRKDMSKFKLPDSPGVYFFRAGKRPIRTRGRTHPTSNGVKILYIGKATSLRDRVRSYFSTNLTDARSSAIAGMIEEAGSISWKKTDSVLEALILEANLIKRHQPKYNVEQKDDKSFNSLVITKEDFPRVLVMRGRELLQDRPFPNMDLRSPYLGGERYLKIFGPYPHGRQYLKIFGPYPHGRQLQEALKIVRKIFPFRDKCTPCDMSHKSHKSLPANSCELAGKEIQKKCKDICKPCFNRQLGLCPGVCRGEINMREYARIIRHITTLFSGKLKMLKKGLEREMHAEAKAERYENAEELRRQIKALEHIRDVSLIKNEGMSSSGGLLVSGGARIEAYDVAHTSGTETVAVMTVVDNGELEKESYRKFKIRTAKNDDVAALKEALSRRLAHGEWVLPRVFVVDGGTAQLRAATNMLKEAGIIIPVVAVIKNEFHKPERMIGDAEAIEACGKEILLANQEAHRFAVSYHRARRRRQMI
ncbi:MAG: hypothetical protein Q7S75_03885 [bacterium]|nr:hypothetical protein [bacterium]